MRNYEDVVIVFFFTTRFGFGFRSFFLRDCSRSRAPRIFFPTRLFPFPGRKRRSKRKKKEKRREKKEKIRFVASRKLHLSLELFIGNIIYRMKRFSRPVPVFLSPSRESTEFRYRMIKYCRETFARSVRIVSGNFSTTITLRNF